MINFLQQESTLNISDNSGALKSKVIYVKAKKNALYGLVRLTKVLSVKTLKRSNLFKTAVTGHKKALTRSSGVTVYADKNESVLLKKDNTPLPNRIYKPVYLEFKYSGFSRLCSLSKNLY